MNHLKGPHGQDHAFGLIEAWGARAISAYDLGYGTRITILMMISSVEMGHIAKIRCHNRFEVDSTQIRQEEEVVSLPQRLHYGHTYIIQVDGFHHAKDCERCVTESACPRTIEHRGRRPVPQTPIRTLQVPVLINV